MPATWQINTGDGVLSTQVQAQVQIPDGGQSISLGGQVKAPGQAAVPISGGPLTAPTPPVSGSIFWQIQVDLLTGVALIVQSTVAYPPPVEFGPKSPMLLLGQLMLAPMYIGKTNQGQVSSPSTKVAIFQMTLTPASPGAYSQNTTAGTPNQF